MTFVELTFKEKIEKFILTIKLILLSRIKTRKKDTENNREQN